VEVEIRFGSGRRQRRINNHAAALLRKLEPHDLLERKGSIDDASVGNYRIETKPQRR
jgi:hypothetical protein